MQSIRGALAGTPARMSVMAEAMAAQRKMQTLAAAESEELDEEEDDEVVDPQPEPLSNYADVSAFVGFYSCDTGNL